MSKKTNIFSYFSKRELILWIFSIVFIVISFLIFNGDSHLTLAASLIGATSLILCAKGNPLGQVLMIIFSTIYGIISYSFSYYGEVITYMGMTAPMSVFALVSWLKNPYKGKKNQVAVGKLCKKDIFCTICFSIAVTMAFFFILRKFNTSNLLFSTISVTTSFAAVYLTYKRSPYFALAYACNDIVLIILWTYAAFKNTSYVSVVVCFITFLINDVYGFVNWKRMEKEQE